MQKVIIILILFSIKGYSQKIFETKDSCIVGKPTEIIKIENMPLKAHWAYGKFLLFTDQQEFESHFKRASVHNRDSIVLHIDFYKNNIIVFSMEAGGCVFPDIKAEYYDRVLQVKISERGGCAMRRIAYQYIIVSKEKPIPNSIRICKTYNN